MKDIKDFITFNKWFGKKILFVEAPTLTRSRVIDFVSKNRVKIVYCLSPIDPNESKFPDKISEDFEKACVDFYKYLNDRCGVHIIPHIHLKKDIEYSEAKAKIEKTLEIFTLITGKRPNEIYFGWGLRTEMFKKICDELNVKISKKMFHYYDFWIASDEGQ